MYMCVHCAVCTSISASTVCICAFSLSIALFCLLLLPVWIILAVSLWRCQTLLKYRGSMRSKSDKMFYAVHQRLAIAILLASCGELSRLLPLLLMLLLLLAFLLNDCVLCVLCVCVCVMCIAFHFVGVCAPAIESNSIRYSRILALLAYNFILAWYAMLCHYMPYHITPIHTHIQTRAHTVSIMYRMYMLIIIKPTCYIITAMQSIIYAVCICVCSSIEYGIEVNSKLFGNRWCENVERKWI